MKGGWSGWMDGRTNNLQLINSQTGVEKPVCQFVERSQSVETAFHHKGGFYDTKQV